MANATEVAIVPTPTESATSHPIARKTRSINSTTSTIIHPPRQKRPTLELSMLRKKRVVRAIDEHLQFTSLQQIRVERRLIRDRQRFRHAHHADMAVAVLDGNGLDHLFRLPCARPRRRALRVGEIARFVDRRYDASSRRGG